MTTAPATFVALLQEYEEGGRDAERLAELARSVGFRLARAKGDDLARLRVSLAGAEKAVSGDDRVAQGVTLALQEAVAAYAIELQSIVERDRLAAYWRSTDTLRSSLIQQLDRGPERPVCLAQRLGKDAAQISRAAKRLESDGLVEKVPVRDDGRGTWYRLTLEGTRVASILREETERSQTSPAPALRDLKIPAGVLKMRDVTSRIRSEERLPTVLKGERTIPQDEVAVAGAGVDR